MADKERCPLPQKQKLFNPTEHQNIREIVITYHELTDLALISVVEPTWHTASRIIETSLTCNTVCNSLIKSSGHQMLDCNS